MIGPVWLLLYQKLKASIAAIVIKREEVYAGTTNGAGTFSVVYSPAFESVPHVDPQIIPQSNANRSCRVTASTESGFTVIVEERATLSVLGLNVVAAEPTPVSGSPISVLVRAP